MTRRHALCSSALKYKMAATYKSTERRDSTEIHFGTEDSAKRQGYSATYLNLNFSGTYTEYLK